VIEWLTVISLVVIGIVLIVLELVFVPGTTIVGVLGLAFSVGGIALSFDYFGDTAGFVVLIITSLLSLATLIYSLRSGVWQRFANKKAINSKFNEGKTKHLNVGDDGEAVSTLKPIGQAEFKNGIFEVTTRGNYLEPGNKVKIIRIDANKIYVEPIN